MDASVHTIVVGTDTRGHTASETKDRTKEEWVGRVLGRHANGSGTLGELPTSKGKGLIALLGGKSKPPPVAWGAPTTTPLTKPVTLKSKTELKPGPRTRTTVGVGELVQLIASESGGTWTTTAGGMSAIAGKKATLTAPDTPGPAVVTVDVAGVTASLSFTVIAPNSVSMVLIKGSSKKNIGPNATMVVRPHIGPDTVNFSHVGMIEDDVAAVATGYWSDFNGIGHQPNTEHVAFTTKVVSGKGTAMNG